MNKYATVVFVLFIMISPFLVACSTYNGGDEDFLPYDTSNLSSVPSSVVAENKQYLLSWDNEQKILSLLSKSDGVVWSSSINEESEAENNGQPSPLLMLEYIRVTSRTTRTAVFSKDKTHVSSELVADGIHITCYFDDIDIAVPFTVTLQEDGINIYVSSSGIVENSVHQVFRISPLPYFCSVQNDAENYLFIPSGSGAIAYTDERGGGAGRTFTGKIYGTDPSRECLEQLSNDRPMRMAVYGAVTKNSAICGIVKEGAEHAFLSANAGSANTGISEIYAGFQMRGLNRTRTPMGYANMFTAEMIRDDVLSIGLYPLSGENANYTGIAKRYGEFLTEKYSMPAESEDTEMSIRILGGINNKKFMFGIPYYTVEALTTFNQASTMVEKIAADVDVSMDVQMIGFGQSGLEIGKVAGGYEFSNSVGTMNEYLSFQDMCMDLGISVFMDYDLINFNRSSHGFSATFNTAKTANGLPVYMNAYSIALRDVNNTYPSWKLLSRSKVLDAASILKSVLVKEGISGVSLNSLGSIAYSDFSDYDYYVCGDMGEDATSAIREIKKAGMIFATSDSNDYAAALSDKIFETPSSSGKDFMFDVDIPFYQIVFKGHVPIASFSVNLAINPERQFLSALETGSSLAFTLINNYHVDYATTKHSAVISSVFEDNYDDMISHVNTAGEFLKSVNTAKIVSHELINQDVRKTTFDNGVEIYINYGNDSYSIGDFHVNAMSFKTFHK